MAFFPAILRTIPDPVVRPGKTPSYRYPTVMRSGDLIQSAFWPGVPRVEAFSYTCSHGISAGVWSITTSPIDPDSADDVVPDRYGNLVITDGNRTIVLRDCKVDRIDSNRDEGGTTYTIMGFDRRWRWRNQWGGLGGISGRYNQTDNRGKLVPWSIRSPEELARLCLQEMGERNFKIDLPNGLRRADGRDLDRYLRLGETVPQSATNPAVDWYRMPPAEALAWLADFFGCRVVYQPVTDRVLIVPIGDGPTSLPDWPYEQIAPGIDDPETPSGVGIWGGPIRVQCRLPLEPVGPEWDGSVLPIDMLSYAPDGPPAAAQVTTLTWAGAGGTPYPVNVSLVYGETTIRLVTSDGTGSTATVLGKMKANGEGDPETNGKFTFAVAGNILTVTAKTPGDGFQVVSVPTWADGTGHPADIATAWVVATTTPASNGGKSWLRVGLQQMIGARATDRLTRVEAQQMAQGAILKWFRVMQKDNVPLDPRDRKSQLVLPGFGPVKRVTQLVVQPTKVEQVVPQPRIAGGANKGQLLPYDTTWFGGLTGDANAGILPEFYNGRSRDQAATVTGSVWKGIGYVNYFTGIKDNTKPTDRVFVSFSVETDDMGNQLVKFAEPVYAMEFGSKDASYFRYPELTLETAVLVTDPESDQLVRYEREMSIPGGTAPVEWHRHDDDLQLGIIGVYSGAQPKPPVPGSTSTSGTTTTTPGVNGVVRIDVVSPSHAYPMGVTIAWKRDGVDYTADLTTYGAYPDSPPATAATRFGEVVTRAAADVNVSRDFAISSNGLQLTVRGQAPFPFAVVARGVWRADLGAEPGDLGAEYAATIEAGGAAPGAAPAQGAAPPAEAEPGKTVLGPVPYTVAPGDLEHVTAAGDSYLPAHARKYVVTGKDSRSYPGVWPLDPDGSIPQVSWRMGDGPTTTGSLNSEHAVNVYPYPTRRRNELLPPNKLNADANLKDNRLFVKAGSPTK